MRSVSRAEERRRGGSGPGLRAELSATLALAAPLVAGNLAQMAMSVTTTVMVGRLGGMPLAAVGLGGMLYFTGGIMLQGVLFAVSPLAAHALGAGDRGGAGRIAGAGLALAMMLALPFTAALAMVDHVLQALGYDAALAAEIGRYLRAAVWGVPAFLSYAVLRSVLAALSHTRSIMTVHVLCLGGHAVLSWALIFGHLGAPVLGVTGSGYASAATQWLTLGGLGLCVLLMPGLRGLHLLRAAFAASRNEIGRILRLGVPIGGMRGIETGLFMTTGVLMGLLGASALAAHQLVLNCAGVTFMVPLGLANAATVRVALQLGADRAAAARRAGFLALALGIAFMSATAIVLWTVPGAIIGLYINASDPANRAIVATARRLFALAALFQVFDGVQVIAAGALRGHKDAMVPLLLATIGYWGVGFAGGWLLAFPLGYGAVGLWWGLALGLAAVAVLLTLRLNWIAQPSTDVVAAVALH